MRTIKKLGIAMLFILMFSVSGGAYSAPAGTNQLRLQTGFSKRTGETAFSYLVTWRKGEDLKDINGLMFVNGTETISPTTDAEVAYKITKALNAAVVTRTPLDRGAVAKNNKSEVIVSNKDGFELTRITTRDYSNQELKYSIPDKSFKAAATGIAIDIVYSAAVEYIPGFSTAVKKETAGGFVSVTIDNNSPIKITTAGKTTREIESELADAIGSDASFSSMPIYPNFVQIRSKNYKSFDGGEIQIPSLNAKSITIDVNDSGLGVLTKFVFTSVKQPVQIISKVPYIIALLLAGIFGYVFWKKKQSVVTS
ncbi:hypothetical protein BMR04_14340 [Methylococcaceae bacterium HT3]|nr:hypothetical protein BMR04_14340 [Methylococcaceae bacterium HT3]TXL22239.1 hypothetical protein BMR03_09485 [Methylococcaceae bacterium HT2]